MRKKFVNEQENYMAGGLDRGGRQQSAGDSLITRSPEEAVHAEVENLAEVIAGKSEAMRDRILADLAAVQGAPREIAELSRERLTKAGVPKGWPESTLALLVSRIKEARLQTAGTQSQEQAPPARVPDYEKDARYKEFNKLFKKDSTIQ